MHPKILVICTLEKQLILNYAQHMEYLPLPNDETDQCWPDLITRYKPQTIIFGLQSIDERKLSLWRKYLPTEPLKFVRKGTSLHRVDFTAAAKYKVEVLNIPGINAPFVAKFITQMLLKEHQPNTAIAAVGIGDIGKKVVSKLLESDKKVILYNRTHHEFKSPNYHYVNNLSDIFANAHQIALCLPLNTETQGIITEHHIQAIPYNGQVICVSPPRIMSPQAIIALHERSDLKVIFDHVASGLLFIHEALGHKDLRPDFIFAEQAAASRECQYAMGEAAINTALNPNSRNNKDKLISI